MAIAAQASTGALLRSSLIPIDSDGVEGTTISANDLAADAGFTGDIFVVGITRCIRGLADNDGNAYIAIDVTTGDSTEGEQSNVCLFKLNTSNAYVSHLVLDTNPNSTENGLIPFEMAWSPDGSSLYMSARRRDHTNSEGGIQIIKINPSTMTETDSVWVTGPAASLYPGAGLAIDSSTVPIDVGGDGYVYVSGAVGDTSDVVLARYDSSLTLDWSIDDTDYANRILKWDIGRGSTNTPSLFSWNISDRRRVLLGTRQISADEDGTLFMSIKVEADGINKLLKFSSAGSLLASTDMGYNTGHTRTDFTGKGAIIHGICRIHGIDRRVSYKPTS